MRLRRIRPRGTAHCLSPGLGGLTGAGVPGSTSCCLDVVALVVFTAIPFEEVPVSGCTPAESVRRTPLWVTIGVRRTLVKSGIRYGREAVDQQSAATRGRLSRDRVLSAAVTLADRQGLGELSMRRLAQELHVVPMALYKHVAGKEELLDGMVDVIIAEIESSSTLPGWRDAVRQRILSARGVLQRHQWARQVLETRTNKTPGVLAYMDSFIGLFLDRGFSEDLTHHVMHAIGSRMWGFTQELFDESPGAPGAPGQPGQPDEQGGPTSAENLDAPQGSASAQADSEQEAQQAMQQLMLQQMAERYPNVLRMAMASAHDREGVVGQGCDDQFEFEFALDLLLDGIERLHAQGWTSVARRR